MAHFPKPFFRPKRQNWYVQLAGKQINLGPDRDAAFEQYHELMTALRQNRKSSKRPEKPPLLVIELIDKFLEWTQKHRSPETYEWYRYRLERFARKHATLTISDIRSFHVQEWADSYRLSLTSVRNYLRTVKRCMQWGLRQGYLDRNPLMDLEVPAAERRETTISDAEFADLLSVVRDEGFRELLIVTWESGCRPQESLRVEARHVDSNHTRWVFPKSESKNKKTVRVVYMTPRAWEIISRLVSEYPTGPLFRNGNGVPWTTDAVNCAFLRVRERLGKARAKPADLEISEVELMKFAKTLKTDLVVGGRRRPKTNGELMQEARKKIRHRRFSKLVPNYSLYAIRHAWATRALVRGVDPLTTAILMGHKDASILAKVYQHLSLNPTHMRTQAEKAAE